MIMARYHNNKLMPLQEPLKSRKKMESDLLHILKELFFILIGPAIGLFAWIGIRLHNRIDKMEHKILKHL